MCDERESLEWNVSDIESDARINGQEGLDMQTRIILPVLVSFTVSAVLGPVMIPFLRKLKVGQTVRDDGPQSHLRKTGTPTMGGLIILTSMVLTSLLYIHEYPKIIPILFATLGFGLIGFLDDYIKVVLRRSDGLLAWQKFFLQAAVLGILLFYMDRFTQISFSMKVPFLGYYVNFGSMTVPILFFTVLGTVNGANFTDGLDGLASSVTVLIATFFTVAAIGIGSGVEPVTCAAIGALLGFLLFNVYPASVFMGDTGSLALGGFVAVTAVTMQLELFLIIVAFVYLAEVCSVILQVAWFKTSGGRRLFRMAPIHHHFEMCGWSETKIVTIFAIVTTLLCMIGFWAL